MSKYKRYPNYNQADAKWIGDFPSPWILTRVKFESYVKARVGWHGLKSDDFTEEGPYLITGSDFKGPEIDWDSCYHCDLSRYEQDPYIQLKNGDLLITKDGTIGKVALVKGLIGLATLNSGVFVVRPLNESYTSRFYFWLLQSSIFTGFVNFNKTGSTIVHLYQDTFVNFTFAMPSYLEQQKIADFLDYETAKIDTLIEKQQELIKLLKEKRQAVISHAVTKGLDPNAPMRDSGVEWLGEVPEHWEIRSISKLSKKITNGYVGPTRDILVAEGTPYIQATHIKQGKVNFDNAYYVREAWSKSHSKSILTSGDVLIVQTGAGTGDIGLVTEVEEGFNCHALIIVQPNGEIISGQHLSMVLQSQYGASTLYSIRTGGMHPHLNCGEVQFVKIPVPSIKEQHEIFEYISAQTNRFDALINLQQEAIGLMQERRTALISAAVTGKIDVRDWVKPEVNQG